MVDQIFPGGVDGKYGEALADLWRCENCGVVWLQQFSGGRTWLGYYDRPGNAAGMWEDLIDAIAPPPD